MSSAQRHRLEVLQQLARDSRLQLAELPAQIEAVARAADAAELEMAGIRMPLRDASKRNLELKTEIRAADFRATETETVGWFCIGLVGLCVFWRAFCHLEIDGRGAEAARGPSFLLAATIAIAGAGIGSLGLWLRARLAARFGFQMESRSLNPELETALLSTSEELESLDQQLEATQRELSAQRARRSRAIRAARRAHAQLDHETLLVPSLHRELLAAKAAMEERVRLRDESSGD